MIVVGNISLQNAQIKREKHIGMANIIELAKTTGINTHACTHTHTQTVTWNCRSIMTAQPHTHKHTGSYMQTHTHIRLWLRLHCWRIFCYHIYIFSCLPLVHPLQWGPPPPSHCVCAFLRPCPPLSSPFLLPICLLFGHFIFVWDRFPCVLLEPCSMFPLSSVYLLLLVLFLLFSCCCCCPCCCCGCLPGQGNEA